MKTEQSKVISNIKFRVILNTTNIIVEDNTQRTEKRSSYKERKGNALAPGADEGRSDLRKATVRRKQPSTRGFPNGETRLSNTQSSYTEYIGI